MSVKSLTGFDANGQLITNLGDPSSATDATTKQYVDNRVDGLSYKDEVRAATTGAVTLATGFENGDSIDGVTLATGNRILVKDQAAATENGIYVVAVTGAPTRATDANTTAELNNATVYVSEGTVNAGREYTQTTVNPAIGSSSIVFAQKSTGTTYTADGNGIEVASTVFSLELDGTSLSKSATGLRIGTAAAAAGLTESSGLLSVGQGTGIVVNANDVAIDPSVVGRKYAANCVVTTNPQTFTHSLNTLDVEVQVVEVSTGATVLADTTRTGVNTVSVNFGGAPTAGQYRVLVQG